MYYFLSVHEEHLCSSLQCNSWLVCSVSAQKPTFQQRVPAKTFATDQLDFKLHLLHLFCVQEACRADVHSINLLHGRKTLSVCDKSLQCCYMYSTSSFYLDLWISLTYLHIKGRQLALLPTACTAPVWLYI